MSDPAINQLRFELGNTNGKVRQLETLLNNEIVAVARRFEALEKSLSEANSKIEDLQRQINALKKH